MRKFFKFLIGFLAFIAFIGVLSYLWAGRNLSVLDEGERKTLLAEGLAYNFVELSEGFVHYRLEGPEDGEIVVLVHGFSTPLFVWDEHIPPLTQAGYQVLAFDNYGRGFSDRPKGAYTIERTDTLLVELLAALNITEKVHMTGYSMGGAITAEFATRHPKALRSVVLVAPAGTAKSLNAEKTERLGIPILGEWVTRVLGDKLIRDTAVQSYVQTPGAETYIKSYLRQYNYRGYRRSLLSTLRDYPILDGVADSYKALGALGIPVTSIWGEVDETVPFSDAKALITHVPHANVVSFADYDHSLTYAHSQNVNGAILSHLKQVPR